MTLRCTIEVVPLGHESRKYCIGTLNIHNVGKIGDKSEYDFEYQDDVFRKITGRVQHNRDDGALVLIGETIAELWRIGVGADA